jgi:hypothetical protein
MAFEVYTVVNVHMLIWTSCNIISFNQCFGGTYCLQHHYMASQQLEYSPS